MALNPVQFGTEVVDQFSRYLLTTHSVADQDLQEQFKKLVKHQPHGKGHFAKGPYVHLNQPFLEGKKLHQLIQEENLHQGITCGFPYETLHSHQEQAIRAITNNKHTIITTGTGSGKTEAFLLPILNHCFNYIEQHGQNQTNVLAVLVYPMNALVNDQLKRLRTILAGTGITYARYTGETQENDPGIKRLERSRTYSSEELTQIKEDPDSVAYPNEYLTSKKEIREKKPMLLLTNYKQLEYLLLRTKDLQLFQNSHLKYLVFDEVHSYTGALGSEVAFLIRRLKAITQQKDNIICIGTSATVQNNDLYGINPKEATKSFAHRLFGVPKQNIRIISESYEPNIHPPEHSYVPPQPKHPQTILKTILQEATSIHKQEEVTNIPTELLNAAEYLCGRTAPQQGTNLNKLNYLLYHNKIIYRLNKEYQDPHLLNDAFRYLQKDLKRTGDDNDLASEILSYLTLGAIAKHNDEPLLRPKLHYFISGLNGLMVTPDNNGRWILKNDEKQAKKTNNNINLPLSLCRNCGQHYFTAYTDQHWNLAFNDDIDYKYLYPTHEINATEEPLLHLTTQLINDDDNTDKGEDVWMCPKCGTLHRKETDTCHNEQCTHKGALLKLIAFSQDNMKSCPSCGSRNKDNIAIRNTFSSTVSDVTIIAQTMLSAMPEEEFQKTLIFTDNRQETAFQAAWMSERSKRFRLRHLLYQELNNPSENITIHNFDSLTEAIKEKAYEERIFNKTAYGKEDQKIHKRIRWFLLEEFCTSIHRKSSTENLGLSQITYEGLQNTQMKTFYKKWAESLYITEQQIQNIVTIILDNIRRKNAVSDPLLQRRWSYTDKEVREGLISTHNLQPKILAYESITDPENRKNAVVYLSNKGNSSIQNIVKRALPKHHHLTDNFLDDLWNNLKETQLLTEGKITYRRNNRERHIQIPGQSLQLNIQKMGITPATNRYRCTKCQKTHSQQLPTKLCPEYYCKGTTEPTEIEEDDYDIVQYTKMRFVPLKSYEHSAQVPHEQRQTIEREFKKPNGNVNCLVCTPTLELGVDLGSLEMLLLRNCPPTPANYNQRAGRAGRRHRIAAIFNYCRNTSHDRYFYDKPEKMIAGEIRLPAFSMNNELLVRKHAHSVILTTLQTHTNEEEKQTLKTIFPTFINDYILHKDEDDDRPSYYTQAYNIQQPLTTLLQKYQEQLKKALKETFADQWPTETSIDTEWFNEDLIENFIDDMPTHLQTHLNRLHKIINTYQQELKRYSQLQHQGKKLRSEEEYEQRKIKNALKNFTEKNQTNYTLSYLADDGFFPGYSLSRESTWAHCLDPYQEIIRPSSTALYEFAPGNYVYANRNQFRIHKLDFYKAKQASQTTDGYILGEPLKYQPEESIIITPEEQTTVGGTQHYQDIQSYELTDVELSHENRIDDNKDYRIRKRYELIIHPKPYHAGGTTYQLPNDQHLRFYHRRETQIINIGLKNYHDTGFPICPRCGEIRSPDSTEPEIKRFEDTHQKRCNITEIPRASIHVQMNADLLLIGPFENHKDAINTIEGIRIGAEQILDTGEMELEVYLYNQQGDTIEAVLLDPMPGGSGFLQKIIDEWHSILKAAIQKLDKCNCEDACYSCMKRYKNQLYHKELNRLDAKNLLHDIKIDLGKGTPIPQNIPTTTNKHATDSTAEERFIDILTKYCFPQPTKDHQQIELKTGDRKEADYIYNTPQKKQILIFIDGTSRNLHGNPQTAQQDTLFRTKAQTEGYYVLTITKQGLQDTTTTLHFLQQLAIYLERNDLLEMINNQN